MIPVATLAIGFFAGRIYQLEKPETFNSYPLYLSGHYGPDPSCKLDLNGSHMGRLTLVDYYRVDDIMCRFIGSEEIDSWYRLQPNMTCMKVSKDPNFSKYIPAETLSIKKDGKNQIRVRFQGEEKLYHRCVGAYSPK